jgi:hypothetical protein
VRGAFCAAGAAEDSLASACRARTPRGVLLLRPRPQHSRPGIKKVRQTPRRDHEPPRLLHEEPRVVAGRNAKLVGSGQSLVGLQGGRGMARSHAIQGNT